MSSYEANLKIGPAASKIDLTSVTIGPENDRLLSIPELARRWGDCHPKIAGQRAEALGIPIIRFNLRTRYVRLSEVVKAEQEAAGVR